MECKWEQRDKHKGKMHPCESEKNKNGVRSEGAAEGYRKENALACRRGAATSADRYLPKRARCIEEFAFRMKAAFSLMSTEGRDLWHRKGKLKRLRQKGESKMSFLQLGHRPAVLNYGETCCAALEHSTKR